MQIKNIKLLGDCPEYYELDALSNSAMGNLNPNQGGSPELFKKAVKQESTAAMELGSLIHTAILEPSKFVVAPDIVKPSGRILDVVNYMLEYAMILDDESILESFKAVRAYQKLPDETKLANFESAKEYISYMRNKPEGIVLPATQHTKLFAIIEAVKASEYFDFFVDPNYQFETAITATFIVPTYSEMHGYVETEVKVKIKPDSYKVGSVIKHTDLKTSAGSPLSFMGHKVMRYKEYQWVEGSFQKYHYYRQLALYSDILEEHSQLPVENSILVLQSGFPNSIEEIHVDSDWIALGRQEYRKLISLYAYCNVNADWSIKAYRRWSKLFMDLAA